MSNVIKTAGIETRVVCLCHLSGVTDNFSSQSATKSKELVIESVMSSTLFHINDSKLNNTVLFSYDNNN